MLARIRSYLHAPLLFHRAPLLSTMPPSDSPPTKVAKTIPAALFQGDELWESSWTEKAGEATLKKRMQVDDPTLILYSSWFCPFAQRAWIAAEETGVNYKWVEINPYQVKPDQSGGYSKKALSLAEKQAKYAGFVETSPRGLVPAIAHDGKVLWESLPVAEYLDATFGGGKLVNRDDPYEVAHQQIWCAHCTDRVQKKFYQALVAQDEETQKSATEQFLDECRALARAMKDGGPYFNGKKFSLVDVALAPFWQRIVTVGPHYFGLTLPSDEPEFQRLETWWQEVKTRPSIANTIVCNPRLIASYQDYFKGVATSDAARNYIK
jgi:glutathione S-transferase